MFQFKDQLLEYTRISMSLENTRKAQVSGDMEILIYFGKMPFFHNFLPALISKFELISKYSLTSNHVPSSNSIFMRYSKIL